MRTADGTLVTFKIAPGQIVDLPDGSTLSFDDWRRWTKLQVSYEPGLWLVIASVLIAVAGVSASLYVRPRRLWLRVSRSRRHVARRGRGPRPGRVRYRPGR
jgi:cytochrome c biogenesis protein